MTQQPVPTRKREIYWHPELHAAAVAAHQAQKFTLAPASTPPTFTEWLSRQVEAFVQLDLYSRVRLLDGVPARPTSGRGKAKGIEFSQPLHDQVLQLIAADEAAIRVSRSFSSVIVDAARVATEATRQQYQAATGEKDLPPPQPMTAGGNSTKPRTY